ncbi:GntR family transcriptional regulator [Fusibacillus kribbianus]|uniref:GntR family transcriptional regulator n=1 Tax=Fusibacillus kribbianus TaxID=3044208 RepID=A0AAP4BAP0_9FIRM|nr:GntR family transcriptional regulator [Ruminococcus sp. YH-rum2234]MDI9242774.1 GntR family transcriptional regulator [Ruminococcus sp. YH-rum2234]
MATSNFGANPSLKQLVYDNLKERIIHGELKPGVRLREEDLSTEMNISRAPIREALNMLERDGFTTIVPRKGALVAEVKKEDIRYIWEMRALLEPYAAKLSTLSIPDKKIQEAKKNVSWVLDNPEDMEQYISSDLEVHEMLVDYLDNRFLKSTLQNMKAHSLRLRWAAEYDNAEAKKEIIVVATKEHLEIVQALEQKDEDLVYETVKHHVENSANRLTNANYRNYNN